MGFADDRLKKFFTASDAVLPMHQPRVLFETALGRGADRALLLEGVGITEALLQDPDARMSYEQLETLERNALRLTNEPALGIYFGQAVQFSQLGLLGLAVMSSASAEAAFRVALQYYRQVAPAWDLELRVEGERAFLSVREAIPRGELRVFATEAILVALQGLGRQALGPKYQVNEVRLSFPEPAHSAVYREFLDFPLRFDQPVTEAEFPAALLAEPIASADPATAQLAERYVASQHAQTSFDTVAGQVKRILHLDGPGRPSLGKVARDLQTSTRSLRRALAQTGTSFQALLDQALRERAEAKMRGGSKLEEVAHELGFSDVRSFRRAFKRWTGRTPNEFRDGE